MKYLERLKIVNYRAIGPEQIFPQFADFNFFIGSNNAGKSSALSFIAEHINSFGDTQRSKLDDLDYHQKDGQRAPGIFFSIGKKADEVVSFLIGKNSAFSQYPNFAERIVASIKQEDCVWVRHELSGREARGRLEYENEMLEKAIAPREWDTLRAHDGFRAIKRQYVASPDMIASLLEPLFAWTPPQVHLIPAIREIKDAVDDGPLTFNGTGLIRRLAELQSPSRINIKDKDLFDKINQFLSTVTGITNARIQIPRDEKELLVHMNGKYLPLKSLGTGIHELIIMASYCVAYQQVVMCIEEPEIHLHPILQRKFIQFLKEHTQNQYFIATHSASLIDTPDAAIYHVTNVNGAAHFSACLLDQQRADICIDLGYKASDLVQANAIVWVEGPSDRLYVNKWINDVDPILVEGIHYSVMFYGGRLLSHLSAKDSEVGNFISLRKLNRNIALIMDSDKADDADTINDTKTRLITEFSQSGGFVWLTQGREIENYIPHDELQKAVKEIYCDAYIDKCRGDMFDHALYFKRKRVKKNEDGTEEELIEVEHNVDKVKVAHQVCKSGAMRNHLDLEEKVGGLVQMIRKANDI